jgi:single-strand DNA-binding protein
MLIGNLTRDPELRYTPQGTPVCTFGLATNRSWMPAGGERQEETEFHRIVAWQKLAELCAQLLFKGRKTYVEGRLQTRRWTGADGLEKITTEIVIDDMIILDSKRKPEEGEMPVGVPQPVVKKVESDNKPAAPKSTLKAETGKVKKKKNTEEKEELTEKDISDIPF